MSSRALVNLDLQCNRYGPNTMIRRALFRCYVVDRKDGSSHVARKMLRTPQCSKEGGQHGNARGGTWGRSLLSPIASSVHDQAKNQAHDNAQKALHPSKHRQAPLAVRQRGGPRWCRREANTRRAVRQGSLAPQLRFTTPGGVMPRQWTLTCLSVRFRHVEGTNLPGTSVISLHGRLKLLWAAEIPPRTTGTRDEIKGRS